ncbi:MAG: hypothetical protein ACTHJ6_00500 [Oryzihumus sp.]
MVDRVRLEDGVHLLVEQGPGHRPADCTSVGDSGAQPAAWRPSVAWLPTRQNLNDWPIRGSSSYSQQHQGTCSHHRGVAIWP